MATAKKATAKKAAAKKTAKAPAKKAAAKKTTATKTAAKKTAPAKKRAPSAAFMKPMTPSPALAEIVGEKPMPRTEVTKKVWDYIKSKDLQDRVKRTMINADAKLKAVVGTSPISMFEMTKEISKHLK